MRPGFSLLEFLCYLAGVAILSLMLVSVIDHGWRGLSSRLRMVQAQVAVQSALLCLRKDYAAGLVLPTNENGTISWRCKNNALIRCAPSIATSHGAQSLLLEQVMSFSLTDNHATIVCTDHTIHNASLVSFEGRVVA